MSVLLMLVACLGAAEKEEPECVPDAMPECVFEPPGSTFHCDTCGQNWACARSAEWSRTDVSCSCINADGKRDTADPNCRETF